MFDPHIPPESIVHYVPGCHSAWCQHRSIYTRNKDHIELPWHHNCSPFWHDYLTLCDRHIYDEPYASLHSDTPSKMLTVKLDLGLFKISIVLMLFHLYYYNNIKWRVCLFERAKHRNYWSDFRKSLCIW